MPLGATFAGWGVFAAAAASLIWRLASGKPIYWTGWFLGTVLLVFSAACVAQFVVDAGKRARRRAALDQGDMDAFSKAIFGGTTCMTIAFLVSPLVVLGTIVSVIYWMIY